MKRLIITAAVALAMTTGAYAADKLGGGCCADLEERVAELEATVARKGNRVVTLEVYGQVHKAFFYHDAPEIFRNKVSIIDGAQSGSRVGFRGEAKINSDVSAGYRIEVAVGGFQSIVGASATSLPGASTNSLAVRYSEVYITSKSMGSLYLGMTDMATNSIVEMDLGETGVSSAPMSLAPADSALIGVSLSPFDGGRANAIRYVSPTVGGFQLSAAWSGDNGRTFANPTSPGDSWDVALRWAGEAGPWRLAAGIGYREDNGLLGSLVGAGPATKSYLGSASVMHTPTGVFISGAYGKQEMSGIAGSLEGYDIRGGIRAKVNKLGDTVAYVRFADLHETLNSGINPKLYEAGLIQEIDPAAMDIYLRWQQVDTDITGISDVNTFMIGTRIKW